MRKKLLSVLLLVALVLSFAACGDQSESGETENKKTEEPTQSLADIEGGPGVPEEDAEAKNESEEEDSTEPTAIPLNDLAAMLEEAFEARIPDGMTFRVGVVDDVLVVAYSIDGWGVDAPTLALGLKDDPDTWADFVELAGLIYEDARAYCEGAKMPDVPIDVIWASEDSDDEIYYTIMDGETTFDCVQIAQDVIGSYVTKAKYNEIDEGMTREEVVEIIGSGGELTADSSIGGVTVEIYTWTAEDGIGTASISFTDGIVTSKAQAGLK